MVDVDNFAELLAKLEVAVMNISGRSHHNERQVRLMYLLCGI
jgi:hypothetical protein